MEGHPSGWETETCFSEGKGTCHGLGAFPCSYMSLDIQYFGGSVVPPFPLTLDACLAAQSKKSSAAAAAFINSLWHQSATALGPPLHQAGFHNLSNSPDLLLLGQEVMHSRSLPTLRAYWLRVGKFQMSTVGPWQGTSSHSHHRLMLFFVFIKKMCLALERSQNYFKKCLWVVRVIKYETHCGFVFCFVFF